jgi:hypothetical protein
MVAPVARTWVRVGKAGAEEMSVNVAAGVPVGGRYRLVSRIASGGAGQVWSAVDETLDRPVAVKLLRADVADDASFRERFRREARAAAGLNHPGVATVYDYGTESTAEADLPYLVMELVDGEALDVVIRRDGRLRPAVVVVLLARTAGALAAAHERGVVHRDVKPSNLLVRADGAVKVTDFGIAQVEAVAHSPLTRTGTVLGTVQYLSPEQASGAPSGPPVDVYALGVVAHECLTGARPFSADSPVAVAVAHVNEPPPPLPAEVPASLADLVTAMLAKDPAARPSAADVAQIAEGLLATEPLRDASGAGASDREVIAGPAATTVLVTRAVPPPTPTPAFTPTPTRSLAPTPTRILTTEEATTKARRGGFGTAVLVAVVVLALAGLGLLGLELLGDDDGGDVPTTATASTVTVPPVVGETRAEAVAMLRAAGLDPDVVVRTGAGTSGRVESQRPASGRAVPPGSAVTLVVGGPEATEAVTVPEKPQDGNAGKAKRKDKEKKDKGSGPSRGNGKGNGN